MIHRIIWKPRCHSNKTFGMSVLTSTRHSKIHKYHIFHFQHWIQWRHNHWPQIIVLLIIAKAGEFSQIPRYNLFQNQPKITLDPITVHQHNTTTQNTSLLFMTKLSIMVSLSLWNLVLWLKLCLHVYSLYWKLEKSPETN